MTSALSTPAARSLYRETEGIRRRRAGLTYQQIADSLTEEGLKTTRDVAWRAVMRAYQHAAAELEVESRIALAEELDRLDSLIRIATTIANDTYPGIGSAKLRLDAVAEVRKLTVERARMLGLYKEQEVYVGGQHVHVTTRQQALVEGKERAVHLLPAPRSA